MAKASPETNGKANLGSNDPKRAERWLNSSVGSEHLRKRAAGFLKATTAEGSPGRRLTYGASKDEKKKK